VQEKKNNFSFSARLFFQFCDIPKIEIISKVDLAKFGYRPDMKVKQIQHSFLRLNYLLLETVVEIWRLIYLFIYLIIYVKSGN